MSKFKIISIKPLKIELTEDCKAHEIIDLGQYFDTQSTELNKVVDDFIDKQYEQKINHIKETLAEENENKLKKELKIQELEIEKKYETNIKKYETDINNLENEKQKLIDDRQKEIDIVKLEEQQKHLKNIEKLENDKKNIKLEIENKFNQELNKKDLDINNLKHQHENELNKQKEELVKNFEAQLEEKQKEIEEIKRERNLLGTKTLGNDLERYCENEIRTKLIDNIGNDGSITLDKDSLRGEDTKADYIVEFKNHSLVADENHIDARPFKIILEMKTESLEGDKENKKTNNDHMKKLIKDATNRNVDVAILVTELEKSDKFLFRRVDSHQYNTEIELYMVRPELLIFLLSTLRIIYLKYSSIKELKDFEFNQKQKILEDFNEFKEGLLKNQINHINNNLEEIIKCADSIEKQAQKIKKSADTILETHLTNFINKIEKFNIESTVKKIEKISLKK